MRTSFHPFRAGNRIAILSLSLGLTISLAPLLAEESAGEPKVDPTTGMIIDDNWQIVMGNCIACHSASLFTNYGGTRETWAGLIEWMQKTQNLWPFDPDTEDKILTYLAKNYPPGEASRRRNLPIHQRPPNPYVSDVRAEYEEKKARGEITAPDDVKQ